MGIEIAENDYLNRNHTRKIKVALQNQYDMFKNEDEISVDRDDCYALIELKDAVIEISHNLSHSTFQIININLNSKEFHQLESEVKNAVVSAEVGVYQFKNRFSNSVEYHIPMN